MDRKWAYIAGGTVLVGLLAMGFFAFGPLSGGDKFADCRKTAIASGSSALGGPFTLSDETGAKITSEALFSRPTLLYFGYSFCPDVCPFDLARNADAHMQIKDAGYDTGIAFVSVDPGRDDAARLTEFTDYFHEDMIGLSGTDEEVAIAKKAFRVYSALAPDADTNPDYIVDHSTYSYLVGTDGKVLEFFRRDDTPESIAATTGCYLDQL